MQTTSVLSYPPRALAGDLVRSVVGTGITGAPLVFIDVSVWVAVILGPLALLFLCFGLLTLYKSRLRIEFDESGLKALAPRRVAFTWSGLSAVDLAYYSVGSRDSQGWMQLSLREGSKKLKMDSRLEGFRDVAARALRAAREHDVPLSEAALSNFKALGLVQASYYDDEALSQDAETPKGE